MLPTAVVANAATSGVHLAHASAWIVFVTGAVLILGGALGVVLLRNPVHCALMLVVTLFGIAWSSSIRRRTSWPRCR